VKSLLHDASVWERVSPYLDEALDLPAEQRASWLQELIGAQPEIGPIVEQLLSELAALDARGFLTSPPLPITRLDTFIPVLQNKLRAKSPQVLARRDDLALKVYATLGKAEALMVAGDADGAAIEAQAALKMAIAMQDLQPYSDHTGLAWLMLGRAWQASGDLSQARAAYDAAVANLSNTVDADHPELLRARKLSAATRGIG
jgi:hypothetical protein